MNTQLHHWETIRGWQRLYYVTDDFGNLIRVGPNHVYQINAFMDSD